MKDIPIILMLLGILLSCSNGDGSNLEVERTPGTGLTGKWQLIEQLMDPGDGSGTFVTVDSDHIIEFFDDGKFKSSESLCYATGVPNPGTTGTVDPERNVVIPEGCRDDESLPAFELSYSLQQPNLIINLFCVEPCALKFKKVK